MQRQLQQPTSFGDVCTSNAGLVEVLGVDSGQGVEQGVPGGVVPPVTQVDAPHEGDEAPLQGFIAHVGIGCRLSIAGRAVVTGATPHHLLQLVFGPGTFARSSPGTACNTEFQINLGVGRVGVGPRVGTERTGGSRACFGSRHKEGRGEEQMREGIFKLLRQ